MREDKGRVQGKKVKNENFENIVVMYEIPPQLEK